MTPFSTFASLYMTALFLELAERWSYPGFTLVVLLLAALFVWIGITRVTFLIFLAVTTSHFLLVQFPDVANHVNVAIYCNILMMTGIGYSLVRSREFPTDADGFELIRPLLQISMILVYALAGFHKLNTDFFDPAVSCVADLVGDLTHMAGTRVAGIPTRLVLLAGIVLLVHALLSAWSARRSLSTATRVGVLGVTVLAGILVFRACAGDSARRHDGRDSGDGDRGDHMGADRRAPALGPPAPGAGVGFLVDDARDVGAHRVRGFRGVRPGAPVHLRPAPLSRSPGRRDSPADHRPPGAAHPSLLCAVRPGGSLRGARPPTHSALLSSSSPPWSSSGPWSPRPWRRRPGRPGPASLSPAG